MDEQKFLREEALAKIQEFQSILSSSNSVLISSRQMLAIGIGLMLVPVVELTTDHMTFGADLPQAVVFALPTVKAIFWGALFYFAGTRFGKESGKPTHPLIKKAFGVEKPAIVAIVVVALGLGLTGHAEMVYPTVFVILGLLYNLIGRFSHKSVTVVSWSYLAAGLLYMYLNQIDIANLWAYFLVFHGITCCYIGLSTRTPSNASEA